jgi:leader peptidase (prepilin peptidase) / N-methyltransferase
MNTAKRRIASAALYTAAVTPLLRWLIAHHSVAPGQPWRTRCECGIALWPNGCQPSGRCRACRRHVGPPPYAVEAATLTAALALLMSEITGWELAAFAWWAAGTTVLAFVDLAVLRLPHRITAATTLGTLALLAATGQTSAWARAVTAAAVLSACFAALAVASRGQLGWGDVALAVPVAAALGWHSWAAVYAGTLLGLGAAAAAAVTRRTAKLQSGRFVPLGPFLIAGAAAALTWQ